MVKKTNFNAKVTEIEGKIPDIKNLASKTEVTTVENKIPNISNLVLKTDHAAEITKIENDSVTNALDTRHKDLVQQTIFDSEFKKVDDKARANSSKVLSYERKLKQREDTINDLERNASYSRGKNYFDGSDRTPNCLVFQGVYKYFEDVDVSKTLIKFYANSWISKGLSNEKINSVTGFKHPFIAYTNARIKLKFDKSILRQKSSTCLGSIANYYIVYRLSPRTNISSIVLENCLFGKIKMIKNVDSDKYNYQGHGIGFDSTGTFAHPNGGRGKNFIIFGVDMTNSKHANNKIKDFLVLGRGLVQRIDETTIYAEKMHSPNFTIAN